MKYNRTYFLFFLVLFVVEASIAFFLKDGFIRHTFGDFLVVIMVYCLLKSFINIKPITTAIIVLTIAFGIEFLQLTNLLNWIGLNENVYAKLILGSTFHFTDLIAYTLGIILIIVIESHYKNFKSS